MNEFDEQLRRELDRRAGGAVPVSAGHDTVLARAGRIRRRRASVAGGGALTAIVVAGLVLLTPGGEGSIAPADTTTPIARVTDTTPEQPGDDSTPGIDADEVADGSVPATVPSVPTTMIPTTTAAATATSTRPVTATTLRPVVAVTQIPQPTSAPRATVVATTLPTAPTSSAAPTSTTKAPSTTAAPSTSSSSSSTTPSGPAPFTRTYDSTGGSITVNWNGAALSLLSVAPAPGFAAEVEDQSAERIRVRFSGEPDDSRIEVRVDDGELSVDIS